MMSQAPNFCVHSVDVFQNEDDAKNGIDKHLPFILRGVSVGSCVEAWTPKYLSSIVGEEEVKIHVSEFPKLDFLQKNFIYRTLSFNKLLERASEYEHPDDHFFICNKEYYYLRAIGKNPRKDAANIKEQYPVLSKDIMFPEFVPQNRIYSSVFRIGSGGLSLWTHYDVMDNALIQVKGKKRAILFPPTDALHLYLNGEKSEVLDVDNPDVSKFPKFQNATRYECCLLPGDVLYIPAFWFHNMKYLDFGIAVNVFWKELEDEFYDKKDPYGNKDLLPAQQAFTSLDKALKTLSKLPAEYKKFYYLRLIAHLNKKIETDF